MSNTSWRISAMYRARALSIVAGCVLVVLHLDRVRLRRGDQLGFGLANLELLGLRGREQSSPDKRPPTDRHSGGSPAVQLPTLRGMVCRGHASRSAAPQVPRLTSSSARFHRPRTDSRV